MTKEFRETEEFKFGRTAELLIAREMQKRGWFVLPSYDYCGDDRNKAPRLQGLTMSYVIPDLDVCRNGLRCWIEVKAKAHADYTRITKRLEHGISLRLYRHYQEVQRISGMPVYLCIFEEDSLLAIAESIDELDPVKRIYDGSKMGRDGMIFFPRDYFQPFAKIEAAEVAA